MIVKVGKEIRTWSLNNTTWDTSLTVTGTTLKIGLIKKEMRNINGEDRPVLFGTPYHEPQQTLNTNRPITISEEEKRTIEAIRKMPPEQCEALLKGVGEK